MTEILVVEDNQDFALLITTLLEDRGYTCTVVADPDAAWDRVTLKTPDLVITDLVLGGRTGWELCEKIRKSEEFGSLPVLVMSAWAERAAVDRIKDMRCNFISKPFQPDQLLAAVDEALGAGTD